MKRCGTCKEKKDLSAFGKRSASKDGLAHKCKECQSEYDRGRANSPHRVEARKAYLKTAKGMKAASKAKRKWSSSNPIKRMANVIVGNAVRDGKISKPEGCESCGSKPKRLHGHHDDYAFPLVVRWLCPGCHNKWHKENGEGKNAT